MLALLKQKVERSQFQEKKVKKKGYHGKSEALEAKVVQVH